LEYAQVEDNTAGLEAVPVQSFVVKVVAVAISIFFFIIYRKIYFLFKKI
jgi:hypothetical protein